MPEGPEVVLPQYWRAATYLCEEMRVELAINQQHHKRRIQGRKGEDDQEGVDEYHPDEQRQPADRKSFRSKIDYRNDQVDGSRDRSHSDAEQSKSPIIQPISG